jgi:hypothetical protein
MPATVTVTGTVGPGNTITAGVFTGITSCRFDTVNNMLILERGDGNSPFEVSIAAATTITATKSGSTYTFTVS